MKRYRNTQRQTIENVKTKYRPKEDRELIKETVLDVRIYRRHRFTGNGSW